MDGEPEGHVLAVMSQGWVLIRQGSGRRLNLQSSRLSWSYRQRAWKCYPKDHAASAVDHFDEPIAHSTEPLVGHMVLLSFGIVKTFGWVAQIQQAEGTSVFILTTADGTQAVMRDWIEPGAFAGSWALKPLETAIPHYEENWRSMA